MYQLTFTYPKIEGVEPVELNLKDGRTAYVVFDQELKPDMEFDTVAKYHVWLNENIERPNMN